MLGRLDSVTALITRLSFGDLDRAFLVSESRRGLIDGAVLFGLRSVVSFSLANTL